MQILQKKFPSELPESDNDPAALLRYISPVAWQHINFYGRFEFASIPALIDIASIVQAILTRAMPPNADLEL